MFFRALLVVTTVLISGSGITPAKADHIEYYEHNGSLMKMIWDEEVGEFFSMYYERPRAGLSVRKGTLFMSGSVPAGGSVTAWPRTYKRGCDPAKYRVTGRFDEFGNLSLSGKAPVRQGCRVIGYSSNNNSSLVFTRR